MAINFVAPAHLIEASIQRTKRHIWEARNAKRGAVHYAGFNYIEAERERLRILETLLHDVYG